MKNSIMLAAVCLIATACSHKINPSNTTVQSTDKYGSPMLLGTTKQQALTQQPYAAWFNKNYADYQVDSTTAAQLQPYLKNKQFEIFLGTWCGDSQREVPRMLKLLAYCGVPSDHINMIMVDNHDSTYKQSPGHEEKGKYIHRVPDLLVYEKKEELGRIVESPVTSLEKDLLNIVERKPYQPEYAGAAYLSGLLKTKSNAAITAQEDVITSRLKQLVKNSAELNTLGYVLMTADENEQALLVYRLNAALFAQEPGVYNSLAKLYLKQQQKQQAVDCCNKVLALEPGNAKALAMLATLNR